MGEPWIKNYSSGRDANVQRNLARYSFLFSMILFNLGFGSAWAERGKIIEFGWDERNTSYIRQHIAHMETLPFDGTVFSVRVVNAKGELDFLSHLVFSGQKVAWESVQEQLKDLQQTPFRKFSDNFMRVNLSPSAVDWFEDFTAPLENCKVVSRMTRLGGVKGIFFDLESYEGAAFDYRRQKYSSTRTFKEYAAQVRRQAERIMESLQARNSRLVVMLSYGYGYAQSRRKSPEEYRYGLLRYFLDGLFAAAGKQVTLVDGFEGSYGYRHAAQFNQAYRWMHEDFCRYSAVPEIYARKVRAGFGVWMDYQSKSKGWNTQSFSGNAFSPREFERSLRAARRRSDRYVWVYSERLDWWSDKNLPQEYLRALERARKD